MRFINPNLHHTRHELKGEEIMSKGQVEFTKDNEYYTPKQVVDFFGQFDYDPATTKEKAKEFGITTYDTIETDGLKQDWTNETVYVNPPYSKCKEWVFKSWFEWFYNNATVVMLLPVRTDTKWFHQWVYNIAEIRFLKGRLKFGDSKNSAPFPSMIVIFRSEI